MTPTRAERVQALFAEALTHEPASRDAFLHRATAEDETLRDEVAALLASAAAVPTQFLDPPPPPPPLPASLLAALDAVPGPATTPTDGGTVAGTADPLAGQLIGRRVGAYEIIRPIAAGGMGIVFEAVQAQPHRTVALKLIRPQHAGTSAVRRFRLEAELLGRLRHPGIAQVYEFGEADTPLGRTPFFAMEYVPDALSLTRYADAAGLSTRERLELFAEVCDAVQHGHMNGVIHRDLKPGNILVGQERHAGTEPKRHEGTEARRHEGEEGEEGDQNPDRKGGGDPTPNPRPDREGGRSPARDPRPDCEGGRSPARDPRPDREGGRIDFDVRDDRPPNPSRGQSLSSAADDPTSGSALPCGRALDSSHRRDGPPPRTPLRASVPSCLRAYPKVIDFGVARVDGGEAGLTTAHTMTGQIIGTVQYMSPEQCDGDPNAVDVRSDVYSLGVILYELLTGTLPYVATSTSLVAATRAIREQAPARPSTINRKLRGDIETVVLKALEKDRTRRYQSAEALARDIRHVLNREPIEARRATMLERAVKWAVRHPVVVTLGACGFILIATAVISTTAIWIAIRRPHDVVANENSSAAILRSVAGKPLHTWDTRRIDGVAFTRLIDCPARFGGGRLAVVGYRSSSDPPAPGSYAVYSVHNDLETPLMELRIADDDVPYGLRVARERPDGRRYFGSDFGAKVALIADVFPEPDSAKEDELIAVFQHYGVTQAAICVYRFDWSLLFRVWCDADICDLYWMKKHNLLVCAGSNNEVPPGERQTDKQVPRGVSHLFVVFAISPELGFVSREYVAQEPRLRATAMGPLQPKWHYCVLPVDQTFRLTWPAHGLLSSPDHGPQSPDDAVTFTVNVRGIVDGEMDPFFAKGRSWIIANDGTFADLPKSEAYSIYEHHPSEPATDARPLAPYDSWRLGELPPMAPEAFERMHRSRSRSTATDQSATP